MKKNDYTFIILCILSFALLIVSYSNHFNNSFQFDDSHNIVENLYIRDIKNIPRFFKDPTTQSVNPQHQGYRPLLTATFAIDYWIGNGLKSTFYFHLTTFIFYVIQCLLMYFIYLKIFNTAVQHQYNKYFSLFCTSWYALHTVNAETINYIYQRADSLSTFMVIAGLFMYAYLPKWRRFYIYMIPVILGMFVKESTTMFAPLLFFYIMFFERNYTLTEGFRVKNTENLIKDSAIAFIVCGALAIFVISMYSPTGTPGGTSRFLYLITQPFVLLRYFVTFFFPFNLSADTDWKVLNTIFDIRFFIGIIFIFSMLYIAHKTSMKKITRPISFGILWFFISLLPTSSIIPLAEVTNDHRMFFPFVGMTLGVTWALALYVIKNEEKFKSVKAKALLYMAIAVILLGNAYGIHERNKVWKTEESLWYDVTIKSPNNGRGLMNYGLTQMAKGKYEVAEEYFQRAMALTPHYAVLHINMGILKGAMNKRDEAEKYFKNAINYWPYYQGSYFYYARWLKGQGRYQEALELVNKALEISPGFIEARNLLDEIKKVEFEQSLSPLELAERLVKEKPTAQNYLNLSLEYYRAKRFHDTIKACYEALKIKPDYDLAYNNICSAYNELKEWDKAIEACEKGLSINPNNQRIRNNLKWAKEGKASKKAVN